MRDFIRPNWISLLNRTTQHDTHVSLTWHNNSRPVKSFREQITCVMITSHQPFEAAASIGSKGLGLWFRDSDHNTTGTRLSSWHVSDLRVTGIKHYNNKNNLETTSTVTIRTHRALSHSWGTPLGWTCHRWGFGLWGWCSTHWSTIERPISTSKQFNAQVLTSGSCCFMIGLKAYKKELDAMCHFMTNYNIFAQLKPFVTTF